MAFFCQDSPVYHGLSDFLVLLYGCGCYFCKMGGNTQDVSSCPWYMFMTLLLRDGFVLAGLSFVSSPRTFLFCSTVLTFLFHRTALTKAVSSCPWYNYMELWLVEGFVLGGLYFVSWAL